MANRRMFSLNVVDTDKFLDMDVEAQCLYFHLGMHSDDDGFVASPNKIMRSAGVKKDSLEKLIQNGYVIRFDSGVVVITHWKIHNHIQNDRYHKTVYQAERGMLALDKSNTYCLDTERIQDVSEMESEARLGKDRIGKDSIGESEGRTRNTPTLDDIKDFCFSNSLTSIDTERFYSHYESKGWVDGNGNKIISWQAKAMEWDSKDRAEQKKNDNFVDSWDRVAASLYESDNTIDAECEVIF